MKEIKEYDAIVVGSGISGGWAAKELTEKGLKTLVLERGPDVNHISDYPTAQMAPWEFNTRLFKDASFREESPIQSSIFQYNEANKHFFVNDSKHPYIQNDPFHWIRGYQVGGRSLTWGRQCYRWSPIDFEANAKDGSAIDWPIRYEDLEPWYSYVEKFIGISGEKANIKQLPDSEFLPPIPMNCVESHFSKEVAKNFNGRNVIPIRLANLTQKHLGRGPCLYRNLCDRGCVYGGYFSSNSATLPAAKATGNLVLRPNSIVKEIIYDSQSKRASGLKIIDQISKEEFTFKARIIFLNASTIASAAILLNSKSPSFPNGLGNSSNQLGHNLMDHFSTSGTVAEYEGFNEFYYSGRNPGGIYIPRFHNLNNESDNTFKRGYALHGKAQRQHWEDHQVEGFGKEFKEKLSKPGKWQIWLGAIGETLPYYHNRVELSEDEKDEWGIPLVKIHFRYGENELSLREDSINEAEKMLEKAGFGNIRSFRSELIPGSAIHEMGTARMGKDPKTSVLNAFNQMHDVKNIFITDGSCMTSSATQNPSLTYMALTARACDFAVKQFKKGLL
tara:strand:+ start:75720 stop:77399 length:1680 start_codon:yes stop_codon:yes gene_type:complete